jgi:hypothetical protein
MVFPVDAALNGEPDAKRVKSMLKSNGAGSETANKKDSVLTVQITSIDIMVNSGDDHQLRLA